jgi:hypothetical protein
MIPPGDDEGLSFNKPTKQLLARNVGLGHLLMDLRWSKIVGVFLMTPQLMMNASFFHSGSPNCAMMASPTSTPSTAGYHGGSNLSNTGQH